MVYYIRINRHIRNVRVYSVLKKMGKGENLITKLFKKALKQGGANGRQSATGRLG